MRGRDGGAGGGAPLAEGAIGVGAAGAGGQGAGGAGRQLARQLDGALTLALPAPVELGRGLHRHRPLVGRAGAGAARAGIDVRGAVVHRHAAAHQVRPPGPRRRLFPRPRFLAGGPLPRRATRGADLWHHPAATACAPRWRSGGTPATAPRRSPSWVGCIPSWPPSTRTWPAGATRTATAWPRSSIPGSPARTTRRCGTPTSTTWRSRRARCRPTSATTCATPTRPTGPPTPPTTATSTWP